MTIHTRHPSSAPCSQPRACLWAPRYPFDLTGGEGSTAVQGQTCRAHIPPQSSTPCLLYPSLGPRKQATFTGSMCMAGYAWTSGAPGWPPRAVRTPASLVGSRLSSLASKMAISPPRSVFLPTDPSSYLLLECGRGVGLWFVRGTPPASLQETTVHTHT